MPDASTLLDRDEARWLFELLWTPGTKRLQKRVGGKGYQCEICLAPEGMCIERYCIRTRVTNKLGLQHWALLRKPATPKVLL